jgi:hydroxymethylpyrimidine/phosphomethylpyrimidine kinase
LDPFSFQVSSFNLRFPMTLPVVLTIAGSDSSCGAGAQADLKTFSALGCHGLTAITCIVAEIPGKVRSIQAVKPEIVRDQLEVMLAAYPVAAIKTGMLFSSPIIRIVANVLRRLKKLPPLVIDPVMVASSGDRLLHAGAISAYRKHLFPMATLITPNLDELGILTGSRPRSIAAMRDAGKQLTAATGAAALLKGGHLRGRTATDLLLLPDWEERSYSAPFVRGVETHGTGCTYSAAIAAGLAKGLPLPQAVGEAKRFITRAVSGAFKWGRVAALDQVQKGLRQSR